MLPTTKKTTPIARRLAQVLTLALMVAIVFTLAVSFADGNDIGENVKTGLGEVYGVINVIALPAAAIAFAFCGFKIWIGGERGMEQAKRTAIYTLAALALVYLAPVIVQQAAGWFGSGSAKANFTSLDPAATGS